MEESGSWHCPGFADKQALERERCTVSKHPPYPSEFRSRRIRTLGGLATAFGPADQKMGNRVLCTDRDDERHMMGGHRRSGMCFEVSALASFALSGGACPGWVKSRASGLSVRSCPDCPGRYLAYHAGEA